MIKWYKIFLVFLISTIFHLSSGCNNPESSDYIEFIKLDKEENGIVPFSDIRGIEIKNSRGGVIIYGSIESDTISYTLSKTIRAKNNGIAQNHIDDIKLHSETNRDTLKLFVLYPFDTDDLYTSGYIDLYIPFELPLNINNMTEGIFVYYMANDIIISDVKDHIEIKSHSGSCNVQTQKGDIHLEIALPDSGYCIAKTDIGDIKLTVPTHTSAIIYAKTYSGSVKSQHLDLSNQIRTSNSISGTLGNGEGEIFLETRAGNILIEILEIH